MFHVVQTASLCQKAMNRPKRYIRKKTHIAYKSMKAYVLLLFLLSGCGVFMVTNDNPVFNVTTP